SRVSMDCRDAYGLLCCVECSNRSRRCCLCYRNVHVLPAPSLPMRATIVFIALLSSAAPASSQSAPFDTLSRVDSVFASVNNQSGPGCSVGIGRDGAAPILRAYGSASLEFG